MATHNKSINYQDSGDMSVKDDVSICLLLGFQL
jgi:hypothetical protein